MTYEIFRNNYGQFIKPYKLYASALKSLIGFNKFGLDF